MAVIGGFRGGAEGAEGAEGAAAPPIFLYFQNVSRFCFENYLIKCSLILSSETLTLLYFASRIRPQCCMLYVLKNEVFIRGGVRVGDSAPSFGIFWIRPWPWKVLFESLENTNRLNCACLTDKHLTPSNRWCFSSSHSNC